MTTDPVAKAKALHEKISAKNSNKEVRLPDWPENKRGTPNAFLCSALFSASQGKNRIKCENEVVASHGDLAIVYSGELLNQEDLTLWETLVHLAKDEPLQKACTFSAYAILKKMGLGDGGVERRILNTGITRLTDASVKIVKNDKTLYSSHLVQKMALDELTGFYSIQLNADLINLYKNNTWIDWDQRAILRKKPLAQFLHGYYSSHKAPYPVKIETLHKLSGSKNKRMSDFKQKVIAALDQLVEIQFLESYSISDNLVTVKRLVP